MSDRKREERGDHRSEAIGIVGSRDFPWSEVVVAFVGSLPDDTLVVSGGAPGVDTIAEQAARQRGLDVIVFPADWKGLGRKAGPIRNGQIVAAADHVVAFWDGASRGTLDTVAQALRAGKPVVVYGSDGNEVPVDVALTAAEQLSVITAMRKTGGQADI